MCVCASDLLNKKNHVNNLIPAVHLKSLSCVQTVSFSLNFDFLKATLIRVFVVPYGSLPFESLEGALSQADLPPS